MRGTGSGTLRSRQGTGFSVLTAGLREPRVCLWVWRLVFPMGNCKGHPGLVGAERMGRKRPCRWAWQQTAQSPLSTAVVTRAPCPRPELSAPGEALGGHRGAAAHLPVPTQPPACPPSAPGQSAGHADTRTSKASPPQAREPSTCWAGPGLILLHDTAMSRLLVSPLAPGTASHSLPPGLDAHFTHLALHLEDTALLRVGSIGHPSFEHRGHRELTKITEAGEDAPGALVTL